VLIVWASEDRVMPPAHGRRLAEIFPDSRLVEIADSYTLVPEDQPELLSQHLRDFVSRSAPGSNSRVRPFRSSLR
jgi:pimeloyl-ACP methyl ester carboxylesterase